MSVDRAEGTRQMDEILLKQLTRQLKVLNFWISVFGTLILVAFIVIIILLYRVVSFVQDTSQRVTDIQESARSSLDVRQQICDQEGLSGLLRGRTDVCE